MIKTIAEWPTHPTAWKLLFISALGLEVCALYFQYVLDLQPCIMCVYQRTAVFGVLFAALLGIFSSENTLLRLLAQALWLVSAIWGLLIAREHVAIQQDPFGFFAGCEIVPNFPSWAPLHEWLPQIFAATGDCGDIDWQFLGMSMPQWMVVVFGIYTALAVSVTLIRWFALKKA
ncbi:disulfide bond formation protein DsbB [Bowmanella sp. JS7-9]|uniref:Disulfide bond formation protein B n=1 Tax=Pseudobowmanella zhangzhouensis TaxID=1537679 RepID=A0ABW1XL65_9ALTE|nr:disulfide bond formation protein DsbB [Bowmanella sp. JS7-9]